MAAPKRTKIQRENDLPEIAREYVRGCNLREIAEGLAGRRSYTLSIATISRDVATVISRWRAEAVGDVAEHKARELARLHEVEREAWIAWEQSKQPATRELAETITDAGAGRDRFQTVKETKPDPRYLQIVQAAVAARSKLLGLDSDFAERLEALERKFSCTP